MAQPVAKKRPSLWWWSLDLIATCTLAASIWFAGGAQAARALVCFSLAVLIGAFALMVRAGLALDRPSRWLHVAVVPALFVADVLAREPLIRWTFEYRFSRARPVLTEEPRPTSPTGTLRLPRTPEASRSSNVASLAPGSCSTPRAWGRSS